ncbi:hypothetical protein BH11GEM2_BH11GEM2_20000 [soil metagenome]
MKATYSLDEPTVKKLAEIARKWDTSKSDVLSRLINQGEAAVIADEIKTKLDALDRVTEAVSQLPPGVWEKWQKELRKIHEGFGPHDDEPTMEQQ